jgi:hypothetical protein
VWELRGGGHKVVQSLSVQVANATEVEASLGIGFELVAETDLDHALDLAFDSRFGRLPSALDSLTIVQHLLQQPNSYDPSLLMVAQSLC